MRGEGKTQRKRTKALRERGTDRQTDRQNERDKDTHCVYANEDKHILLRASQLLDGLDEVVFALHSSGLFRRYQSAVHHHERREPGKFESRHTRTAQVEQQRPRQTMLAILSGPGQLQSKPRSACVRGILPLREVECAVHWHLSSYPHLRRFDT
jgi:hypothetical protein